MTAGPSIRAVEAFVASAVERPVVTVEVLTGSVANFDFRVGLADRTALIVKVGPRSEMAAEAWACRRLSALGVPVPEVVLVDLDDGLHGLATIVLGFLDGSPSADLQVLRQAGEIFRRVHGVQLSGWGPIVVEGSDENGPARGRHDSWSEAVLDQLSGLPELVHAGIIDADLAEAVRSNVLVDACLDYAGPGVLLHNDLKPAHLFAVRTEPRFDLSGVIDWGDARVGDPRAELARLSMTGMAALEAFLGGYGLRLTAELARVLSRYRIGWNAAALSYEYRAGGDWFEVYRGRVADDINRLAGRPAQT